MNWKKTAWVTLVVFTAGCSSAPATHSQFQTADDFTARAHSLKKIGVIIDTRIKYEVGIFENAESGEAQTATLTRDIDKRLAESLLKQFTDRGYTLLRLPASDATQAVLNQYTKARGEFSHPFEMLQGVATSAPPNAAAMALEQKHGLSGIVIVSANDSLLSRQAKLEKNSALAFLVVASAVVFLDIPPFWGSGKSALPCPQCNMEFALLSRDGKILYYDRDRPNLESISDIAHSYARIAENLRNAGSKEAGKALP